MAPKPDFCFLWEEVPQPVDFPGDLYYNRRKGGVDMGNILHSGRLFDQNGLFLCEAEYASTELALHNSLHSEYKLI